MTLRGLVGRIAALSLVLSLCGTLVATAARAEPRSRRAQRKPSILLAVTIDDLPAVGGTPEWSKARMLLAILAALQKHQVPEPVGFFNGSNMDDAPETRAALTQWIQSGALLGNHTYSHDSADEVTAAAFEQDIERDQDLIGALDPASRTTTRYFRYPYLDRGNAKNDAAIRRFLRRHGYRIADVSVDFDDWAFSAAYQRCSEQGNQAALNALSQSYIDYALAALAWSADSAQRLLGRAMPQVLLIHADLFTAQQLDALLTAYEEHGVRFVPLAQVLADPVYQRSQNARHGDVTLLRALARERNLPLPTSVPIPMSLLDALCP